jgi:hypothetical protein
MKCLNYSFHSKAYISRLKEKYSSNALAQSLLAQRPLINERKMLDEATKKEQDISRKSF